jgi:quercetin dioxygenase-like cupin family protein
MKPHRHDPAPALPDDVLQALASGGAVAPPAPERIAAMKARVLAAADAAAPAFVTVHRDDGAWQPLAPDIAIRVLDSDDTMQAYLLKLAPGACLPAHPHPADEMCFVLEGDATLGDLVVGAGDYHLARAGSTHGDVTTRNGCVLLIRAGSGAAPHRAAAGK